MMLLYPLILTVMLKLGAYAASESESSVYSHRKEVSSYHRGGNPHLVSLAKPNYNVTFFEKENMLRVPMINKKFDETKYRKKSYKKTPKRTIQKIIKKSRTKSKKLYLNQVTSQTTESSVNYDLYQAEDLSLKNENQPTTQVTQKKKARKWNSKLTRYPMPFQRLQSRKETNSHRRNRRESDRDVYIFEDLDEMEFVNKDKDYNVVNANVKRYW